MAQAHWIIGRFDALSTQSSSRLVRVVHLHVRGRVVRGCNKQADKPCHRLPGPVRSGIVRFLHLFFAASTAIRRWQICLPFVDSSASRVVCVDSSGATCHHTTTVG